MELLGIARRYRWRFVIPAFLVMAAVLTASLFLPRKFIAQGIFERKTDAVLTEMGRGSALVSSLNEAPRNTADEMTNRVAIEQVLEDIEPLLRSKDVIKTDADLIELRDSIVRGVNVVTNISGNEIQRIRVSYTGDHPDVARLVVNGLINQYIKDARKRIGQRLEQSAQFFRGEVERTRAQVETLESQLLEFEIQNADLLPDHPFNLQAQIAELQQQIADAQARLASQQDRAKSLAQAIENEPTTTQSVAHGRNPELDELAVQLKQQREKLHNYRSIHRMTDKHPDVQQVIKTIKALEQQLAGTDQSIVTETRQISNSKRAELEIRLTEIQNDISVIEGSITALKKQLANKTRQAGQLLPVRSAYRKLERQLAKAQRQITFWEDNLRRSELALTAESGDRGVKLAFTSPARSNYRPVSPQLSQVLVLAVGLAMAVGVLCVFLAHRSDETFNDGEQLATQFDLPLLGSVSEVVTDRHRHLRRIRKLIMYPANATAMAAVIGLLVTVLYLDLEDPDQLSDLKSSYAPWIEEPGRFNDDALKQKVPAVETAAVPTTTE